MGKIRNPQYRIVVANSRTRRDGRAIEFLGLYHPKEEPSRIEVNSERVQHWLGVGAQPSDPVRAILSKTGDWQKFKGLPAPEPLKVAAVREDRRAAFEVEAQAAAGIAAAEQAAKPKKSGRSGRSADKAEAAAAPKAEEPVATEPVAKPEEPAATEAATAQEPTGAGAGTEA
jgi:small subunit ribosomal protein S16